MKTTTIEAAAALEPALPADARSAYRLALELQRPELGDVLEALELRDAALAWLEAIADELPRTMPRTTAVYMRNRFAGLAFNLRIVSAVAINTYAVLP